MITLTLAILISVIFLRSKSLDFVMKSRLLIVKYIVIFYAQYLAKKITLCQSPRKLFPYLTLWWISHNFNRFFSNRMNKFHRTAMQMDRTIFIGCRKTIFQITFDGLTDTRELRTNLVRTPRFRMHFQQMIIANARNQIIRQFRFFGIWMSATGCI